MMNKIVIVCGGLMMALFACTPSSENVSVGSVSGSNSSSSGEGLGGALNSSTGMGGANISSGSTSGGIGGDSGTKICKNCADLFASTNPSIEDICSEATKAKYVGLMKCSCTNCSTEDKCTGSCATLNKEVSCLSCLQDKCATEYQNCYND